MFILNLLAFALLIGGAALALWLARWATRLRHPWARRLGPIFFALGALGCVLVLLIAALGFYRLEARASNPVPNVKVAGTAQQITRGERLAHLCLTCHASAPRLPLDGSTRTILQGGPPIGTLYGPNLTPGGPTKTWSDGELVRAIREGVGKNGRPLLGMPSWSFVFLSDDDVQALVAYLRSQPAVERTTPPRDLNILAAIAIGIGLAPTSVQPPVTKPVTAPPMGPTAAYGEYLVNMSGCRDCHGKDLNGAKGGFSPTPAGPSMIVYTKLRSQEQFISTMRTGITPSGRPLKADLMPWQDFNGAFTDDELKAIYLYLASLAP